MPRIDMFRNGTLEFQVVIGQEPLRVGRGERCDIRVNDRTVSRVHALIIPAGDTCLIRDLSMNGTWVNGERMTGERELAPGDRIHLGELFTLVLRHDHPTMYTEGAVDTAIAMTVDPDDL